MKNLGTTISLATGITGFLAGGIALWVALSAPKIGVVRSDELVYNYAGMEEAKSRYSVKRDEWRGELDSLAHDFQNAVETYRKEQGALPRGSRESREKDLSVRRQSLERHRANLEQKAAQEDRELTDGVLRQVNTKVREYGERHGYDVILGTGSSGNILHTVDAVDITQDVLREINGSYRMADKR